MRNAMGSISGFEIGLVLTKRLAVRMDYMPFEHTVFLDAAQSFDPVTAVFNGWCTDD